MANRPLLLSAPNIVHVLHKGAGCLRRRQMGSGLFAGVSKRVCFSGAWAGPLGLWNRSKCACPDPILRWDLSTELSQRREHHLCKW